MFNITCGLVLIQEKQTSNTFYVIVMFYIELLTFIYLNALLAI